MPTSSRTQKAPTRLITRHSTQNAQTALKTPPSASMLVFLQNGREGISAKKAEVAIPKQSKHLAGIQMPHADDDMLHAPL